MEAKRTLMRLMDQALYATVAKKMGAVADDGYDHVMSPEVGEDLEFRIKRGSRHRLLPTRRRRRILPRENLLPRRPWSPKPLSRQK